MAKRSKKVCIIGGGPFGISMGKALKEASINFDLYETGSDFGGLWNENGQNSHTYPSLHLISPKLSTEFTDFPMPENYPHYPNHKLMLRYIRSYAKNFGVYEHAHFNVTVMRIEPLEEGWEVELSTGEIHFYYFVLVCNGLQNSPSYPSPPYPGEFTGNIMHSLDYKNPDLVRGQRVLIIGAGNSGCDIAADTVHHCKKVFHSTRRGYYYQPKFINGLPTPTWMEQLGNKFKTKEETLAYISQVYKFAGYDGTDYGLKKPDYALDAAHPIMNSQLLYYIGHGDISTKVDVESFQGKTVIFKDGSQEEIDTIIYSTGYTRKFPFLDSKYLEWKNNIPDCFLHIVPKNIDNLFFIGFVNYSAAGLGIATKSNGQFVVDYINAYNNKSAGFKRFNQVKNQEQPDLGQDYYIDSNRHQWEVDVWKFLKVLLQYRDMIREQ